MPRLQSNPARLQTIRRRRGNSSGRRAVDDVSVDVIRQNGNGRRFQFEAKTSTIHRQLGRGQHQHVRTCNNYKQRVFSLKPTWILGSCYGSIRLSIKYVAIRKLSTDDVVASAHSLALINIHKTRSLHARHAWAGTAGQAQNEEGGKMAASKIDFSIVISDTDRRELNEFQSAKD